MTASKLDMGHLFCLGYGYTAQFLAGYLISKNWRVSASTRSGDVNKTVEGVLLKPFETLNGEDFDSVTHILISIPPTADGDPVLIRNQNKFFKTSKKLRWIGYLSATSVYGDAKGLLVSETSPAKPSNNRAKYRLLAEKSWLNLCSTCQLPIHIFRLAGIYGPHRNVFQRITTGNTQTIDEPNIKFSRIHVDDIVKVLFASMVKPAAGQVYNVCDDKAAMQSDVLKYAADLLQISLPRPVKLEVAKKNMSPFQESFWRDNKIVSNKKIKADLGILLQYPTYEEGLLAIFKKRLF